MATIKLCGPRNHFATKLDAEQRVIGRKCPQCSQAGQAVFHYFDADCVALIEEQVARWGGITPAGSADPRTS